MRKLCIIPARGGSKRIPRKNIKSFLGKPIITYSIEAAINSRLFDEVMVSTDDPEIASIAKQSGANVPFLRSAETSDDHATTVDVLREVIDTYASEKTTFDAVCCIYPTAPFVRPERLQEAYTKLIEGNFDTVFPIMEFSYPIQRSLVLNDAKVSMLEKEHLQTRSQDLPKRYHDTGQYYWFQTKPFLENHSLFTDNSGGIVISELEAQDIDSITDWKLAELKYKLVYGIS